MQHIHITTRTNFEGHLLQNLLNKRGVHFTVKETPNVRIKTLEQLLTIVATRTQETEANIKSKVRKREYVYPRQLFFYMSEAIFNRLFPLKQVGGIVGGRHHTTVLYGRSAIIDAISLKNEEARKIQRDIDAILNLINS